MTGRLRQRCFVCFLTAALVAVALSPAMSEPTPKAGLMWQRTGMPAVFPLIVKSNVGRDYYMTLYDTETDQVKLAAFVNGGAFFRVLVPPGDYEVRFASGFDWQGEDALFGDETQHFNLPDALTFAVQGHATKAGHLIDLKNENEAPKVEARALCQRYALVGAPRPLPPFEEIQGFATRLTEPGVLLKFPGSYFDPARLGGLDRPAIPTDFEPYLSRPSFRTQMRLC